MAVVAVGTPADLAPSGVRVAALRFETAPPLTEVARRLVRHVPISGAAPTTVAGQPALATDADATFASTLLWVGPRVAIVVYGSTRADEEPVLAALIPHNLR